MRRFTNASKSETVAKSPSVARMASTKVLLPVRVGPWTKKSLSSTGLPTSEYPTARWIPWSIAGAGGAIALGGLGFWLAGRNQMSSFQQRFDVLCAAGCSENLNANPVEQQLADQSNSAHLKAVIGVSMIAAGGAALAGGVVWAILNRPKRVLPTIEVEPTTGGGAALAAWRF